jgi:hypothetical protein
MPRAYTVAGTLPRHSDFYPPVTGMVDAIGEFGCGLL